MAFPATRLEGCFPELYGFVLLDPARLDDAFGGTAAGRNLLERFSTTALGDRVSAEGIAIPLLEVEAGLYSVLVRHESTPSPWPAPELSSPGWVLGTTTGSLLLCGLGHLIRWRPDDPRHRRIGVPAGWYTVEVRGHRLDGASDDAGYEFVLASAESRPPLLARVDRGFGTGGGG